MKNAQKMCFRNHRDKEVKRKVFKILNGYEILTEICCSLKKDRSTSMVSDGSV